MDYQRTQRLVQLLQAFADLHPFTKFDWVPTDNTRLTFKLEDDTILMSHVDLSPGNICDGQLLRILEGYRALLKEAQTQLADPKIDRRRKQAIRYGVALDAWELTHPDDGDGDGDDDDDDFELKLDEMIEGMASGNFADLFSKFLGLGKMPTAIVMPPEGVEETFEYVVEQLDINPSSWSIEDQYLFMADLKRYDDAWNEVLFAEELVTALEQFVAALDRERTNRQNKRDLDRLTRLNTQLLRDHANEVQALETQHLATVRETRIEAGVAMARAMKTVPIREARTAAINEVFPDVAAEIIARLNGTEGQQESTEAPVEKADQSVAPSGEGNLDWLNSYVPDGDPQAVASDVPSWLLDEQPTTGTDGVQVAEDIVAEA